MASESGIGKRTDKTDKTGAVRVFGKNKVVKILFFKLLLAKNSFCKTVLRSYKGSLYF